MWKVGIEEYRENTRACWEFALKGAWDQHRRHPEFTRRHCLQERSFFWEIVRSRDIPLFEEAGELSMRVSDMSEMDVLYPSILSRAEELYNAPDEGDLEFGADVSIRYQIHPANSQWCYMHLRNAKKPESFLKDPIYVAANLRRVMDDSERLHGCTELFTASWLNSFPAFQHFFPNEWQKNIQKVSEDDLGPTTGWQGQFYNRRGLLNAATATRFLETGRLPFPRVETHCPFTLVREHLDSLGL